MITIEQAHAELVDELMGSAGIAGVGIGEHHGRPCIRVYVTEATRELRARIPSSVHGHEVVIDASGEIRALDDDEGPAG